MVRHGVLPLVALVAAAIAPVAWSYANARLELSPQACARALLIVAHPDDEVLFAGEALLGRAAALPGGCRYVDWHVICATNGDLIVRRKEFQAALHVARNFGLAARIIEEIWDYVDCNYHGCSDFFPAADSTGTSFADRLSRVLLDRGPWDYVVTHNEDGEYSHLQHVGLHQAVRRELDRLPWDTAPKAGGDAAPSLRPRPRMLVFNPLPEVNVSRSMGKKRMVATYLHNATTTRVLVFNSLLQYAEHLVTVEEYPRGKVIRLGNFPSTVIPQALHFSHAWSWIKAKSAWSREEKDDFDFNKVPQAEAEVKGMLTSILRVSCGGLSEDASPDVGNGEPWYPGICAGIHRALSQGNALRSLLRRMKAEIGEIVSQKSAENAPAGALLGHGDGEPGMPPPHADRTSTGFDVSWVTAKPNHSSVLRCVRPATRLRRFGSVTMWKIEMGDDKTPGTRGGRKHGWLEVFVARPILVGWKHGYKGRTFRVLASSGPVIAGAAAPNGISKVHVPKDGAPIVVQPDDVLGWGVFEQVDKYAGGSAAAPADDSAEAMGDTACLLDQSEGCDDAGLCSFSAPMPSSVTFPDVDIKLRVELADPPRVKRDRRAAPYVLRAGLNISELVRPDSTYEDFMTARNRLDHPGLQVFEDKIRLRKELLPEVGVLATPSIHLSNTDSNVLPHIDGRRAFVVKPSHMSESQSVFVVADGVNLLQQAWGFPHAKVSAEEIQSAVDRFMGTTALDWECRALVSVRPGVVVEELVLAGPDETGKMRVDEYKFYTVWGRVVFGESVPFSSGAVMEINRDGQIITTKAPCPPHCVAPCFDKMVNVAERVAAGARTDFLRVDILIRGRCDGLFISEVELFPASDFEPHLKAIVADLWRRGYGVG